MNSGSAHCDGDACPAYHGIIVSLSQRDGAIFKRLKIIGRRRLLPGLLILYKVKVGEDEIDRVIEAVQENMAHRVLLKKQEFYAHFYRGNELIVVFRDRVFRLSQEEATWGEAREHGRRLGIVEKQLDFIPNRFSDEYY